MKNKQIWQTAPRKHLLKIAVLSGAFFLIGCDSGENRETLTKQQAELQKLQEENQAIGKLRAENKELPRLRRDNQEIETLKSSAEEIARIRVENETIRKDLTRLAEQAKLAAANRAQSLLAKTAGVAGQTGAAVGGAGQANPGEAPVADPNVPLESDEILIEPRLLAKLLPEFDWEKLERKEPVAIKALLEQQGIVLTNYQQLIEFGITNYTIRKDAYPVQNPVTQ